MKIKYLGTPRRDGSFPQIQIGKEVIKSTDGIYDLPADEAKRLIAIGNFAQTRVVAQVTDKVEESEQVAAEEPATEEPAPKAAGKKKAS